MRVDPVKNSQMETLRDRVKGLGGIDILNYRREFVCRCLSNRIHRAGLASVEEYLEFLDEVKEEIFGFCAALSVYHSEFVRDPVKYQVIKEIIVPEFINKNTRGERLFPAGRVKKDKLSLKVWCAGCAGGEEPYSVAMTISDALEQETAEWDVSITATDINTGLLEKADRGAYSKAELMKKRLSPEYIGKYFDEAGGGAMLIKERIKRMIKFEKADLAACKPRYGMDIIMCRNVLIYIEQKTGNRVINGFHESLNSGGYLILGNSEILDDSFYCKFKKLKARSEFYYRKISEGSPEYWEAVAKRKNIRAGMGIRDGIES